MWHHSTAQIQNAKNKTAATRVKADIQTGAGSQQLGPHSCLEIKWMLSLLCFFGCLHFADFPHLALLLFVCYHQNRAIKLKTIKEVQEEKWMQRVVIPWVKSSQYVSVYLSSSPGEVVSVQTVDLTLLKTHAEHFKWLFSFIPETNFETFWKRYLFVFFHSFFFF